MRPAARARGEARGWHDAHGAEGDGDAGRILLTASADLAASMLGVALLLLAVVLALRAPAEAPAPAAVPEQAVAEVSDVLPSTSGRPLHAREVAELLRRRVAEAPGVPMVDVLPDGLRLIGPAGDAREVGRASLSRDLGAFLARVPAGTPVVLFVFDHAHYAETRAAVDRAGTDWTELSPLEALRTDDRDDWSEGFTALASSSRSEARFVPALRALLDGEETERASRGGPPLAERVARQAGLVVGLLAVALGCWIVIARERRRLRRLRGA